MTTNYKLAVDVGGTFTDVVLFNEQQRKLHFTKTPSSPNDPSKGVINGIKKIMNIAQIKPGQIGYFVHGTTFATNVFLENKGSKVALFTTHGFRDVIEIGRQKRLKLYDLFQDKPSSLVDRQFRFGVRERMKADGEVLHTLNEEDVRTFVRIVKENNIHSIAVSYLHAYNNPLHELRTKEIIKEEFPECHISLSHHVSPEFREYERTITTVVNAYLKPKTSNYFVNLEKKLEQINVKVPYIMKSNGGIMTMREASENVIQTLLSGPVGGVVAAGFIAEKLGINNIITFDMGGTSTDVALIKDGSPQITLESRLKNYPLKAPMIEMETVGAGGGSIGRIDEGGLFKVGPESTGAVPGPACYGNGGENLAITDFNLLLGRIDPEFFLGGEMNLDVEAAIKAQQKLLEQSHLPADEVSVGMVKIANHHMAEAVRLVSVRKGHNPEEFTLFAFGGASPLHATAIARELGIPKVVIPNASSVLSALGFLVADIKHDFTTTNLLSLEIANLPRIVNEFNTLEERGKYLLDKEGVMLENQELRRSLDLRFKGQAFEINVELEEQDDQTNLENISRNFFEYYEREYGFCDRSQPIEVVNYRLSAIGLTSEISLEDYEELQLEPPEEARKHKRSVYLFSKEQFEEVEVFYLDKLVSGNRISGPAIIDGLDTTIIVEANEEAQLDRFGNILISLGKGLSS
ncbi:hydantoinase/oxoprolinase family protein [Aeromicrobium ponti]|uniref:N-methylhydantoinase A n=1 Tax=Cytobacillus oceanisediminis TaxID=665099 RepID=A0A562K6U8_9BACI|nr:hydantoinase/oxoprolinase family protein [Cytobacillus oceanisediminis]TWH90935.1 N-methylhydantoinase A [Cytobacillus oceanisediminis]